MSLQRSKEKARERNQALMKWRRSYGCLHCGNMDERVLQFAHKHGEAKIFNIGDGGAARRRSSTSFKLELDKCLVLCANCHLIYDSEKLRV